MFDAFARLLSTLATARRAAQPPRDSAAEKSAVAGSDLRRCASAIVTLIGSPASTELAIVLLWSLGALVFVFAYGDPQLGSDFPSTMAMN